jgi:hypothetical protein
MVATNAQSSNKQQTSWPFASRKASKLPPLSSLPVPRKRGGVKYSKLPLLSLLPAPKERSHSKRQPTLLPNQCPSCGWQPLSRSTALLLAYRSKAAAYNRRRASGQLPPTSRCASSKATRINSILHSSSATNPPPPCTPERQMLLWAPVLLPAARRAPGHARSASRADIALHLALV